MTINGVPDRRGIVDERRAAGDDYLCTRCSRDDVITIDSERLTLIKLER